MASRAPRPAAAAPVAAVAAVHAALAVARAAIGPGLYGVACSGGADSLALADAAIATLGAAHVVVITVDHGLRPDASTTAAAVAAWARGQGAAAVVRRVEVGRTASLEAAARAARYAALDETADTLGLAVVLLGHTARDQAETVLLRVLRGTGPAGLAAMAARRGRYLRPLLELPRAVVDAYAAARVLPVIEDPMNADRRFARVRVRTALMPQLAAENPAIEDALCRLARASAEWREVIDALAAPLATLPADCAALAAQPPAVRKRALAIALDAAGLGYDAAALDRLDAVVTAPPRGTVAVDLAGGRVERRWDALTAFANRDEPAGPRALGPPPSGHHLRPWRPGDRMRPRRRQGRSRKLSDLLAEARIPRAERAGCQVLVRDADGVVVWAEHVGWADGSPPVDGFPLERPLQPPGLDAHSG